MRLRTSPVLERREAVEERRDPAREDRHQQHRERDPRDPRVEPPQRRPPSPRTRRPSSSSGAPSAPTSAAPFTRSRKKTAGVVLLKPWRSSITKVRQRSKGRALSAVTSEHAEDRGEAAQVALAERARGQRVDHREAAAEGEQQQQRRRRAPAVSIDAEAQLLERVVGRLAVRLGRDQRGEVRGHALAMARDVARLAPGEEEPPGERAEREGEEEGGEPVQGRCDGESRLDVIVEFYGTRQDPAGLDRHGDVGARSRARAHPRGGAGGHRLRAEHRSPQAPVLVIHQPDAVLDAMDTWNKVDPRQVGADRQGARLDAHRGRGRDASWSSS